MKTTPDSTSSVPSGIPVEPALADATGVQTESVPQAAARVVLELRDAIAQLIQSLPERPYRAADLKRTLGVDQPLASRTWRLAGAREAAEVIGTAPTINQLRRVVRAAEKAGAKPAAAEAARAAIARLSASLEVNATDIAHFEAMVVRAPGGAGSGEALLRKHRRAAFMANNQVWGARAQGAVHCCVFFESEDQRRESVLVVRGFTGFHSLRPGSPLELRSRFRFVPGYESAPTSAPTLPAQVEAPPPVMLTEFGSGPTARLETVEAAGGYHVTRVCVPVAGKSDASTFYFERVAHDTADTKQPAHPVFSLLTFVQVPAEWMDLTLWVPGGRSDPSTLHADVYACGYSPENARLCREDDRVEVHPRVAYLGRHVNPPPNRDIPRWSEAISHVLEKHHLAGRKFDVYGCRVAYPILHSVVRIRVDGVKS